MSPKRNRSVREIVEKYRLDRPALERADLRTFLRLSYPEIFGSKSAPAVSRLKTLDRELKRSFKSYPLTRPQKEIAKLKELLDMMVNRDAMQVASFPDKEGSLLDQFVKELQARKEQGKKGIDALPQWMSSSV